jgi:hypothetical protein
VLLIKWGRDRFDFKIWIHLINGYESKLVSKWTKLGLNQLRILLASIACFWNRYPVVLDLRLLVLVSMWYLPVCTNHSVIVWTLTLRFVELLWILPNTFGPITIRILDRSSIASHDLHWPHKSLQIYKYPSEKIIKPTKLTNLRISPMDHVNANLLLFTC